MKVKWLVYGVVIMVLMLGAGNASAKDQPQVKGASKKSEQPRISKGKKIVANLRWATASSGGAWPILGAAMLEDLRKANPGINGTCVPGNATGNIMGVHQGKYELGFTMAETAAQAWNGEGYFNKEKIQDIRAIAALYPNVTQMAVWEASTIKKIEDLKGKKVSPGPRGNTCETVFARILKLYGMSYKDMRVEFLSFDDAAQQMIDGHLDCLAFTTVYVPFPSIINVNSQRQIRLLSLPDEKVAALAKLQGIEPYVLPTGTHKGVNYPVKGIATRNFICAKKDLPDDIAYELAKTVAENMERYGTVINTMKTVKPEDLARDTGVPMHPGAQKYYREQGWIK
ncbi:MAG: TAXI family TRAP transporter solute-binding subunit [Deltaproteobacteria bacterium]|nr:TAXI family TRAP transporter solute-binding subunit [Deltaproteobacteria bacterium]